VTIYSFDVLPIHERPHSLETFTGWLRRNAAMNFLPSVDALVALCFPSQNRRVARQQADYPPLSIEEVAQAMNCEVADVRATTFYHLGSKFARSPHPQALSRFLSGTIAPHLRYCPACIGETGYYRLTWRFATLIGCREHYCELLDCCGYCNAQIPLFCAPFNLDRCLSCGARLSDSRAPRLSDQVYEVVKQHTEELSYLLTPQPWEVNATDIIILLGAELKRLRLIKRQTAPGVSQQLGMTISITEGIERGNVQGRGASFCDYLAYAEYLNTSVVQLIRSVIVLDSKASGSLPDLVPQPTQLTIRQDIGVALLRAVQVVVEQLEAADIDATQETIGAAVGMTPQGLKKYPVVADFLRQYTAIQVTQRRRDRQSEEAQLLQCARDVAIRLQASQQPVSQRAIARELNLSWSSLREYSSIRTWLKTIGETSQENQE
jgi:hypothetical protein